MKICLVRPPLADSDVFAPPLGLFSIYSAARARINRSVSIIDLQYLINIGDIKLNKDFYKDAIKIIEKEDPDILGLQTLCINHHIAVALARAYKKIKPRVKILLGGPQATLIDKETLEMAPFIDFILRGEAEENFVEFIKNINHPEIVKGLTWRDRQGAIKRNPDGPCLQNLDKYSFPDKNLAPFYKRYFRGEPAAYLEAVRGCPFKCTYCSTSVFWGRSVRLREPQKVFEHMKYYRDNFHVNHFHFSSDNFTVNRKWLLEFCSILSRNRKHKLFWECFSKIDHLSPRLIRKMAKVGLTGLFIGVESGSQRMQKILRKNNQLSLLYPVIKECVKKGIDCKVSFMMGFPEETPADLNATLETMLQLRLLDVVDPILNILSPVAGTEIHNKEKNDLLAISNKGGFSKFTFQSKKLLSLDELKLIRRYPKVFSSFYNVKTKHLEPRFLYNLHLSYLEVFRHFSRSFYLFKKELNLTSYELFKEYFEYIELNDLKIDDAMNFADFLSLRTIKIPKAAHLSDLLGFERLMLAISRNKVEDPCFKPGNGEELLNAIPYIPNNAGFSSYKRDVIALHNNPSFRPELSPVTYIFSRLGDGAVKYRKLKEKELFFLKLIDGERSCVKIFGAFFRRFPRSKTKEPLNILLSLFFDDYICFKPGTAAKVSPEDALILFHSRTGHTEKKAHDIEKQIKEAGMTARILRFENARPKDLLHHKIICIGSPTYYDLPALEVELFLKKCDLLFPKLKDKSWYLFVTSQYPGSAKKALDHLKKLLSDKNVSAKYYNSLK